MASNATDIDGLTTRPDEAGISGSTPCPTPTGRCAAPTGGVVSNFPPLEGTGAGNTTQETTELEISGRQDFFAGKKISMPGVSL